MRRLFMTDTNTDPNYQDILNKYSKDLADNPDSEIPQNPPEPETATLTEVESTPVDEPVDTLANHTEDTLSKIPEAPIAENQPDNPPSDLPSTSTEAQPDTQSTTQPITNNPVIDTEIPSENITPPVEEPKSNNFFKYLFLFALIAFIIVLVLVLRSFLNSQSSSSSPDDVGTIPSVTPMVSQQADNYCVFNDQRFTIGQQFVANDGCNNCVCGEDLQINCTTLTCPATQSSTQLSPTSAKPSTSTLKSQVEDWNTYTKSSENLSWDKCEGEPTISVSLKDTVSKNPIYTKTIDGVYLAYSLKSNFTAEDIDKFVMCQAGGEYPIKIIEDKILWVHACSTGIAPDNPKCDDTLSAIKKLYGYVK